MAWSFSPRSLTRQAFCSSAPLLLLTSLGSFGISTVHLSQGVTNVWPTCNKVFGQVSVALGRDLGIVTGEAFHIMQLSYFCYLQS